MSKPNHMKEYDAQYGNLMSYKYYTRRAASLTYGSFSAKRSKHQQIMQEILQVMFENGPCTTWDIAKIKLRTSDVSQIRTKEKAYRRLFLGRYDTKKRSGGMLDLGLVTREMDGSYSKYRLSLHGILYCLDVLNPSRSGIDIMVGMYADVLPRVFGRWDELKSVAGDDIYKLRILAKGLTLDNPNAARYAEGGTPLYEIMSFVHAKYTRNFESMSEHDLAEQISYWFYTFLQYYKSAGTNSNRFRTRAAKVADMLAQDAELSEWYSKFFREAVSHYKDRLDSLTKYGSWMD